MPDCCPLTLTVAVLSLKPSKYVAPLEAQVATNLHVRQGIGYADRSAIAGLLVNPTLGELEAFGDLLGGEYFDGDNCCRCG